MPPSILLNSSSGISSRRSLEFEYLVKHAPKHRISTEIKDASGNMQRAVQWNIEQYVPKEGDKCADQMQTPQNKGIIRIEESKRELTSRQIHDYNRRRRSHARKDWKLFRDGDAKHNQVQKLKSLMHYMNKCKSKDILYYNHMVKKLLMRKKEALVKKQEDYYKRRSHFKKNTNSNDSIYMSNQSKVAAHHSITAASESASTILHVSTHGPHLALQRQCTESSYENIMNKGECSSVFHLTPCQSADVETFSEKSVGKNYKGSP